MEKHPIQGGVEILLIAFCYRNQHKLQPDWSLTDLAHMQTLPMCKEQSTNEQKQLQNNAFHLKTRPSAKNELYASRYENRSKKQCTRYTLLQESLQL